MKKKLVLFRFNFNIFHYLFLSRFFLLMSNYIISIIIEIFFDSQDLTRPDENEINLMKTRFEKRYKNLVTKQIPYVLT